MRDVQAKLHLMHGVQRAEPIFVRGQGSWLWDREGRAYLDFSQGQATNSLGHSPNVLVEAIKRQADSLINVGPSYYNRSMLKLAAQLCQATGSDQAYFLSSGVEANQAAIRLARTWGRLHKAGAGRIVMTEQALARGVLGESQGFCPVPFNDLQALQGAIDAQTVAIMLEPVQADAGAIPATLEYLQGAQRLCREHNLLLILDEVQTGLGRCGALLAEELYGVRADVITLGKGLGGGVPLAALLARGNACCLESGAPGGTHHGNALMTSIGLSVLDTVLEPGFLEHVRQTGELLREGLARLARRHGQGPLRGQGLLIGLPVIGASAVRLAELALDQGLLINAPRPDCLCFSPALTVSHGNVEEMLKRLDRACTDLAGEAARSG